MERRTLDERRGRAFRANVFLRAVADRGRHFFRYANGEVSRFEVDDEGHLWFVDGYRGDRIWTHVHGWWGNRFTNGGTMQQLCLYLKEFVMTGKRIPPVLGPWDFCDNDLWGYGDDMELVRGSARDLGLLA